MTTRTVQVKIVGDSTSAVAAVNKVGSASQSSTGKAGKAFQGLAGTLNSFGVFGPFGAAIEGIGTKFIKSAEEGETAMGRMKRVGTNVAVGFAAAVGAVAVIGIKKAGDFERQLNLLVTAAGELPSRLKAVGDGILQISSDTGTSTDALAAAMYMIEKSGLRGADGLKTLRAAAQGATEENANLTDVTKALTSVMATYQIPASQATNVMNMMVEASRFGKITMEEFSSSLSTVVPLAKAAGLGFDQVAAAMATLTLHGTSAQEASQELAFAIRNLQAPNNVAINEMQQLGINSNEVSQQLGKRGLTGTIDYLTRTVLAHMKGGEVLVGSFNQSKAAANDLNVMLAHMPPKVKELAQSFMSGKMSLFDWRKEVKGLPADQAHLAVQFQTLWNKAHGFSQQLRLGTPAAQTFNQAMKQIMGGANGLNVALMLGGDNMSTFSSTAEKVSEAGKKGGKDIQNWDKIQATFNQQLKETKESANVVAIEMGTALLPAAKGALGFFKEAFGWLAQHKEVATVLVSVAAAIGAIVIATKIWTAVQIALDVAMNANPVGLIIIAVAALVAGIIWAYNNVKWFRDGVNAAWEWIKNAVKVVVDWFVTWVWPTMKAYYTFLWEAIKFVFDLIIGIWNFSVTVVTNVVKFWINTWTWGVNAVKSVINFFVGVFKWLVDSAHAMGNAVGTAVHNIIIFFTVTLPQGIRSFIINSATWLFNTGHNLVIGLWNGIVGAWNWFTSSVANIFNGLIGWIRHLLGIASPSKVFHGIGQNLGHGLANGILATVGVVKDAAGSLVAATTTAATTSVAGNGPVASVQATNQNVVQLKLDGDVLVQWLLQRDRRTGQISVRPA